MTLSSNGVVVDADEVVSIQGYTPGSTNEGYLARALDFYNWSFDYQVPFRGGRVQGGAVLDFVVQTEPLRTPVLLNGVAWHGQKKKENDDFIMQTLVQNSAGRYSEPVIVLDTEVPTYPAAQAWVLRTFGRP